MLLLLRGRLILHRDIASPFAASHGLDIGSVLYGLREVADVADDVLVAVDGKRDDGHKAEGEPGVALDDMSGPVTTVVALTCDTLITFDFLAEGVFTACEYQTHRGQIRRMRRGLR